MSYYEETGGLDGLGSLVAGYTFPIGQQLVAGYSVASSATAADKLAALRAAMAAGFRGSIVNAGWGGPGAPGGVPAGSLWITVRIGAGNVTGADMNAVFSSVGQALQARLPAGSRVTNTHAAPIAGTATSTGLPGASLVPDPVTGLLTTFGLPGGTTPVTTSSDTMLPEENFFMRSVGGIPVWGLIAGGVAALGAVAFVTMRPKKAAVAANRRRRSRRNRRRHR